MRVYVHLSGKYNLNAEDIRDGMTILEVLSTVGADADSIESGYNSGTVTIQLDGTEVSLDTPVNRANRLLVVAGEFEAGVTS